MPGPKPKRTDAEIRTAVVGANGNQALAARRLGINKSTLSARLKREREFERDNIPQPDLSIDEILERRKADYAKRAKSEQAQKLIGVKVKIDGPVGILHFGDPHVDDDGTDIIQLERHIRLVQETPGLFGGAIGDYGNNWVGRLANLYANQATRKTEATKLIRWFFESIDWLYCVGGNHDHWTGQDGVVGWLLEQAQMVEQWEGVRLALRFPNGREVRVNARHDFRGHSQWNPAHGPLKAAQLGWRDHILICGHTHISGYAPIKDPNTGTISHAIRLGTYKIYDPYAKREGFPDGNFGPACLTVIDPAAKDERDLVTVHWGIERGAEYLSWLRSKQ